MPHKITVDQHAGITRVEYYGEVSLDERVNVAHQLSLECKVHGRYRFLIDIRKITNTLSSNEQVVFGKFISSRSEFAMAKTAIVRNPQQAFNQILVKAATEHLFEHKVFCDSKDAENWLKQRE